MKWHHACVAILALALGTWAETCHGQLYGIGDLLGIPHLITIDPTTGLGTDVAALPDGTWAGLTWDGSKFYSFRVFDELYSIDLAGNATLIGESNKGFVEGYLAYDPSSATLFGGQVDLLTINTTTAVASLVGDTGRDDPSGLAFDSAGRAYMLDTHTNTTHQAALYTVDTATGATTLVGPLGPTIDHPTGGLEFIDDVLYGVWADRLYTINTGTGSAAFIGQVNYTLVTGIAYVPEPSSLVLGGVGIVALGAYGYRRRHRLARRRA